MSLRAIKKRETKPYKKQPQHQFPKPRKIPINQNLSEKQRLSKSYPDLRAVRSARSLGPEVKLLSRSDSDVSKLCMKFEENKNLISAKSEVCLKTISVHQTVHANMSSTPRLVREERENDNHYTTRDISTRYRGDVLNNNANSPLYGRRLSVQSFSAYSQTSSSSNMIASSEYEGRGGFADTSCLRIPIVGYEVMEERARFTVFKLRVENPFTNDCWLVLRRYTDFARLNNKLKQAFPTLNLQLPRKKLFGDNFNSVFLDNRVQGLQMFVNSVMANNELRNSKIVREFFCLDEPPTYSESMEECRAIFEAQEETIAHLKLQLKNKDDLILSLQQKLRQELEDKQRFREVSKEISSQCTQCSSALGLLNLSPTPLIDNNKV